MNIRLISILVLCISIHTNFTLLAQTEMKSNDEKQSASVEWKEPGTKRSARFIYRQNDALLYQLFKNEIFYNVYNSPNMEGVTKSNDNPYSLEYIKKDIEKFEEGLKKDFGDTAPIPRLIDKQMVDHWREKIILPKDMHLNEYDIKESSDVYAKYIPNDVAHTVIGREEIEKTPFEFDTATMTLLLTPADNDRDTFQYFGGEYTPHWPKNRITVKIIYVSSPRRAVNTAYLTDDVFMEGVSSDVPSSELYEMTKYGPGNYFCCIRYPDPNRGGKYAPKEGEKIDHPLESREIYFVRDNVYVAVGDYFSKPGRNRAFDVAWKIDEMLIQKTHEVDLKYAKEQNDQKE